MIDLLYKIVNLVLSSTRSEHLQVTRTVRLGPFPAVEPVSFDPGSILPFQRLSSDGKHA